MMLALEGLAALQDSDFIQLGGLNQICWAPSQHRAMEKIDINYSVLTAHLESVAADSKHEWAAECEGILTFITSIKFLKC